MQTEYPYIKSMWKVQREREQREQMKQFIFSLLALLVVLPAFYFVAVVIVSL